MTEDLISRAAAIAAIQKAYCDTEGGEDKYAVWENVGLTEALHIMQDLPSTHPEEATTIFGYPVRHLAVIAKALEDEDITPENVANLVSQMEYIADKMIDEFNRLGEKWMALFGEEKEG